MDLVKAHVCYSCCYPAQATPTNQSRTDVCAKCGHRGEGQIRLTSRNKLGQLVIERQQPAQTHLYVSGDFLKLTKVFVNHSLHCAQCASGNCCEMGDALLTGIGLEAVKEQESLGFAFKAAPFVNEREEQEAKQPQPQPKDDFKAYLDSPGGRFFSDGTEGEAKP